MSALTWAPALRLPGDAARTFPVGTVDPEAQRLIDVTKQCFFEGIEFAKVGYRIGDLAHAIQAYAENAGFSVVRELIGHGIGQQVHESPDVPNYGQPATACVSRQGLTDRGEPC